VTRRKLTREQRIARVLKILGPKADRASVEEVVRYLDASKVHLGLFGPGAVYKPKSKAEKDVAEQLRRALKRVETLLARLVPKLLFSFARQELTLERWLTELQRLKLWAEALANTPLGKPKRHDAIDKRLAAWVAAQLLTPHLPNKVERKGKLCRLAAVLHGDETADLSEHCRAVARHLGEECSPRSSRRGNPGSK
jgi:hypothetical protein